MKEEIKNRIKEIIAASENESLEITKDKYIKAKESGNKVILIAGLNAYTGLDLPGDLIDTLVFAKLPFEPNIKFFSSYNYLVLHVRGLPTLKSNTCLPLLKIGISILIFFDFLQCAIKSLFLRIKTVSLEPSDVSSK